MRATAVNTAGATMDAADAEAAAAAAELEDLSTTELVSQGP